SLLSNSACFVFFFFFQAEDGIRDFHVTGVQTCALPIMIMSPGFRSALAQQKDAQGLPMFPELAWGNSPSDINGLPVDVNRTVSDMSADNALAYVGDFANYFKWGYSRQIPLRVIEYGDPDNSGNDLQGYNQVYIRAEVFLGWGILDPEAFARIRQQ